MSQNEKIRALYVQPGKYPEVIKIPNTLESFQKYVKLTSNDAANVILENEANQIKSSKRLRIYLQGHVVQLVTFQVVF